MTRSSGSEARHLVLVADDDRETREVFQEALEEAGYRVITAANGAVALSLLQDCPAPSLVLLDLSMPVMSGWQVLETMAKSPALLGIPVIVASASDDVPPGIAAALKKPFGQDQLLDVVRRCLTVTPSTIAEGRHMIGPLPRARARGSR